MATGTCTTAGQKVDLSYLTSFLDEHHGPFLREETPHIDPDGIRRFSKGRDLTGLDPSAYGLCYDDLVQQADGGGLGKPVTRGLQQFMLDILLDGKVGGQFAMTSGKDTARADVPSHFPTNIGSCFSYKSQAHASKAACPEQKLYQWGWVPYCNQLAPEKPSPSKSKK